MHPVTFGSSNHQCDWAMIEPFCKVTFHKIPFPFILFHKVPLKPWQKNPNKMTGCWKKRVKCSSFYGLERKKCIISKAKDKYMTKESGSVYGHQLEHCIINKTKTNTYNYTLQPTFNGIAVIWSTCHWSLSRMLNVHIRNSKVRVANKMYLVTYNSI